jgi:hypothetical protein
MHLLACVTGHGWGHLAQTVPIVAALRARLPVLRVTVRTGLAADRVRSRFVAAELDAPEVVGDDTDFGFEMHDALTVDLPRSLARYERLYADEAAWQARLARSIDALAPDAVLSNVGPMPLAAAAQVGVPAFAASSLNWASLLEALCPAEPRARAVAARMRAGYGCARAVFALQPCLPFDGFERVCPVAPIARRGRARRAELAAALGLAAGTRVMTVAFGGLPMAVSTAAWRLAPDWAAVVFLADAVEVRGVIDGERLGWPFIDLLASTDLLVAKPGYGTFAEAGFQGVDTLVVPRDAWPESPWLQRWLAQHARTAPLPPADLRAGRFAEAIASIDAQPRRVPAHGDGAAQVAEAILAALR